jgi:hypothetical protein
MNTNRSTLMDPINTIDCIWYSIGNVSMVRQTLDNTK